MLIPVIMLGYVFRMVSTTREGAITADNFIALEGTVLPAVLALCIIQELKIVIPKLGKMLFYASAFAMYVFIIVGSRTGFYYQSVKLIPSEQGTIFKVSYASGAYVHYIYLLLLFAVSVYLTIYAIWNRKKIAFKAISPYFFIVAIAVIILFIEDKFKMDYEFMPFVYGMGIILITLSYNRSYIHDIDAIVMNVHGEDFRHGYVAFDFRKRFLGANKYAIRMFPELAKLTIDKEIDEEFETIRDAFYSGMERFENGDREPFNVDVEDKTYSFSLSYFYVNKRSDTSGVIFEIQDDTVRQSELTFISNYNDTLHREIDKRAKIVNRIQNKVVLGLANMIENRDSNTGGHVKRTSDVIQIIVDEMMEHRVANLDMQMAEDIVRAAPMHDLGKIAIDNSILCKPGKLTNEEYDVMKTHSPKSGEIVHTILNGVEESHFVNVAYNVAKYHHERYDGNGYPEGLMGDDIPLEARVMALADVYDALVSKRCYKEAMSFEQAREVMLEGMGTQFDPKLRRAFEMSEDRLIRYYKSAAKREELASANG